MTIAIDYDGTWTQAPEMWRDFILMAKELYGAEFLCITGRRDTNKNRKVMQDIINLDVPVHFACDEPRRQYTDRVGIGRCVD